MNRITKSIILLGALGIWSAYPAPAAESVADSSGIQGGLIVHLGCGNGKATAALRATDQLLAHGLDTDPQKVAAARAHFRAAGIAGPVSAATFDGRHLPYVDNLVNLIVADELGEVPMDEIMRVLRPGGVARLAGKQTIKPRPDEIDEWTHFLHGADNNAVANDRVAGSPTGIQWVGGPKWARHHNHLSSTSAMVTAGGRLFSIVDFGSIASTEQPPDWQLVARDAFNGIVLWQKPVGPWESHKRTFRSGPIELPRLLVASNDRVFTTLGYGKPVAALDAATGKKVISYAGTKDTLEIMHENGVLYLVAGPLESQSGTKRIMAVDAGSGKTLWSKSDADTSELLPSTLCIGGGRVFFQNPKHLLCLDAKSGNETWKADRPARSDRISWSSPTLLVSDGIVLSADRTVETTQPMATKKGKKKKDKPSPKPGKPGELNWTVTSSPRAGGDTMGELIAFDAKTGKRLWDCPTAMGYCSAPDVFVSNGQVWVATAPSRNTIDFTEARDLHTGKVTKRLETAAAFTETHHHRCYRNKATDRFIFLGRTGVELISIADGEDPERNCWLRGACQYGVLPANGLLYTPPHSCACYIQSKLSGMWAITSQASVPATPLPDKRRLRRGPAYGKTVSKARKSSADWPTFRGDAGRTGRASTPVDETLGNSWKTTIGGKLTSPVIVGDRVFVAATDEHTVHALDTETGNPLWTFTAGGRIDSPPTIHPKGLVLFGCADGFVYCLSAKNGELAWRFQAAPSDRRTVSFGQLESVWPVTGSVLLDGDTVYCTAGRSSFIDGGMLLYRLNAVSGEMIGRKTFDSRDPKTGGQNEAVIEDTEQPGMLPDVLVDDGEHIYLRDNVLDREGNEVEGYKPHLYCSAGLLDDTWWHRTYWLWGERTWGRASGWGVIPNYRPSGRILVTDEKTVFGFGRRKVGSHSLGESYHLFCADKKVETIDKPIKNNNVALAKYQKPAKVTEHWSREIPFVARAMVLAGDTIYAAGPKISPDAKEEPTFDEHAEAVLAAFSADNGKDIATLPLDAQPVFDGMASAGGRLFVSLTNGDLICLGKAN